jgi:hypothetical protein
MGAGRRLFYGHVYALVVFKKDSNRQGLVQGRRFSCWTNFFGSPVQNSTDRCARTGQNAPIVLRAHTGNQPDREVGLFAVAYVSPLEGPSKRSKALLRTRSRN